MVKHNNIYKNITEMFSANRLHQSILLFGRSGIGKFDLVKDIILYIIKNSSKYELLEKNIAMFKNKLHPDIFLLGKSSNEAESTAISIEDTRNAISFVEKTSSMLDIKIIVINTINDMNNSSCNAILKNLEEPRKNIYFFILCDNIYEVIPTILSRCLKISVPILEKKILISEIKSQLDKNFNNLEEYVILAQGSVGDAMLLININGLELYKAFVYDICNKTSISLQIIANLKKEQIVNILTIFISRIYKIFIAIIMEKNEIEILSFEESLVDCIKKTSNVELIIENFSEILNDLRNIKSINNSVNYTWNNIIYMINF